MSIPKGFGTVVFLFKTTQAAQKVPETKKIADGVYSVRRGNLMKYTVLYRQLANFSIHAGCSESAGDEEGRRWRTPSASRKLDVYNALSAAC